MSTKSSMGTYKSSKKSYLTSMHAYRSLPRNDKVDFPTSIHKFNRPYSNQARQHTLNTILPKRSKYELDNPSEYDLDNPTTVRARKHDIGNPNLQTRKDVVFTVNRLSKSIICELDANSVLVHIELEFAHGTTSTRSRNAITFCLGIFPSFGTTVGSGNCF